MQKEHLEQIIVLIIFDIHIFVQYSNSVSLHVHVSAYRKESQPIDIYPGADPAAGKGGGPNC